MKTAWKVLLGLVLVIPLGAYVAGSLAASASDDPAPRHTIQIDEPGPTPTKTPSPRVSATPDDDVEVITPEYDDLHDDHGGDDHGGGDNSGHGGGGDDNSGHGGGGDG